MAQAYDILLLTLMACAVALSQGNILSPAKIMTLMLAYLYCTDFALRGMSDNVTMYMAASSAELWSIIIVTYVALITGFVWFLSKTVAKQSENVRIIGDLSSRAKMVLTSVCTLVVLSNLIYRIILSGSLADFWLNMFAPRGEAVWLAIRSEWMPGYELASALDMATPMATGLLMHIALRASPWQAPLPLIGVIIGFMLIIANGSRTDIVEAFVIGVIFSVFDPKRNLIKLAVLTVVILVIILFVTAYRAEGFGRAFTQSGIELQYQQDDNFYQTLRVLAVSANESTQWDALTFILTCLVNPIPRSLWPGKPFLDQAFYGNYKDYWVTITSLGELIACFGIFLGLTANTIVIGCIFLFLRRQYRKLSSMYDLIVYVAAALWCYMIMRSLLNISQAAYPYLIAESVRFLFKNKFKISTGMPRQIHPTVRRSI
jgi:oligosaccharide repeat unit polymerase